MEPRSCIGIRGNPAATLARAEVLVADLPRDDVAWLATAAQGRRLLGGSYSAVVVDLHAGLDTDALAQSHGLVRAGGALILRIPPEGPPGSPALAAEPFAPAEVGHHMWARVARWLAPQPPGAPLSPIPAPTQGNPSQERAIQALVSLFRTADPRAAVLTAPRGRGKSSALGLALAQLSGVRIAITGPSQQTVSEVLRFAGGAGTWVSPDQVLAGGWDVVVVDEAARLPVPLLQRVASANPAAHLAFATTVDGYEGTGRGFVLRFLAWLRARNPDLTELTWTEPIRWAAGDPLETAVTAALCLDAQPHPAPSTGDPHAVTLDGDTLAADDPLLQGFFGLLVHAHYRTTPADLHRILDAPNLTCHALVQRGCVVAATMVAAEGGLTAERCAALAAGGPRIRGHALPETLITHAGRTRAGMLRMVRSVRIATHPDLRRRGMARQLVEHVHGSAEPDLFGTVFGATAEVIRFRRTMGYQLVRLGASRGVRTGQPSVVMIRPTSASAARLVADLRRDLAFDLPVQWALLHSASGPALEPGLEAVLAAGLPQPDRPSEAALEAAVRRYAFGAVPYEAVAASVEAWVVGRNVVDPIVAGRVSRREPWSALPAPSVPAAMRALRRGVRQMLDP